MKALIFGILGAIAATLYWRYAVYAYPWSLQLDWTSVAIYAGVGFVVGSLIGAAFANIGSDW
jgi:hypothetical protein